MVVRALHKNLARLSSPSVFAKLAAQKRFDEFDRQANVNCFCGMEQAST